jgi:hypothetical protein
MKHWMLLLLAIYGAKLSGQEAKGLLLGSGFSSATGGRKRPTLFIGVEQGGFGLYFNSVGVRNDIYYHSSYSVYLLRTKKMGELFWGPVRSGLGLGVLHAKRGYREAVNGPIEEVGDTNIGPALRVQWNLIPAFHFFLSAETILGINKLNFLILSFQYSTSVSMGVHF